MNTQKQNESVSVNSNQAEQFAIFPATVREVIPASEPGEPDQARISVDDAREPYNEIRVKSSLRNSCGDTVILTQGDHVRLRVGHSEEPEGGGNSEMDDRNRC